MSTGDLKNQGTKLQSLLRTTKYPHVINYSSLFYGYPQEFLPLLHYVFQHYSISFTKHLLKRGYEMSGKSDKQFIDVVYKVLRDEFEYVPRLSKEKFFSNGYTEQKLILTSSAYQYVIDRCRSSRKQKPRNNKENVNPNTSRRVNKNKDHEKATDSNSEMTEKAPSPLPEHSPIRRAPQPNLSQPFDLSEVIEESIIEIPSEAMHNVPPARIYSEEGARDVFALDHLSADLTEIIDSTPQTVLNTVQLIPVANEDDILPVSVTREVDHPVTNDIREPDSLASVAPCSHAADIADIRKLLVTINARLDILESKAKHPVRQGVPVGLNCEGVTPQYPEPTESLQKSVTFSEPVACDPANSSASSSFYSEEGGEDDIKSFLKSVQEKLNDTRSFLRNYDTTQL